MTFLTPSYVLKKNIEPGAEPMAPAPRPAYTPLNPPALMKPSADCSRVLTVSSGYSAMSTDGPATAPDSSEHKNDGWRPVALISSRFCPTNERPHTHAAQKLRCSLPCTLSSTQPPSALSGPETTLPATYSSIHPTFPPTLCVPEDPPPSPT
eukprot:COSAG02_NODE_2296_length_9197_cov_11.568587_3_plen_152_part_00